MSLASIPTGVPTGRSDPLAVLRRINLLCLLSNYSRSRKKKVEYEVSGTQGFRAAADEIAFLLDCRKWTKFIKVGNSRCCQTGFSIFSLDSAKLLGSSCCWCSLHKNAPCTYIGLCLKNSACSHTFVLLFTDSFNTIYFEGGKKVYSPRFVCKTAWGYRSWRMIQNHIMYLMLFLLISSLLEKWCWHSDNYIWLSYIRIYLCPTANSNCQNLAHQVNMNSYI